GLVPGPLGRVAIASPPDLVRKLEPKLREDREQPVAAGERVLREVARLGASSASCATSATSRPDHSGITVSSPPASAATARTHASTSPGVQEAKREARRRGSV